MNRFDIHADDYALSVHSDDDILHLCGNGNLDSISIIPNLSIFESAVQKFKEMQQKTAKKILVSVHLNFMEGFPCAERNLIPDLVDENGLFSVSWGKLLLWNYNPFVRAKIRRQLKTEILAQIQKCLRHGICDKTALRLDSHQHPHMIPLVFEAVLEAATELEKDGCSVSYIRNTHDPILFYRGKNLFSLNTVKCLILNFYSVRVARCLKLRNMNTNYLCGVYYSSQMDCRIKDVLPIFSRKAEKKGLSIELLFHPRHNA